MDTQTMKMYYERGLWNLERLNKLIQADKITPEQYKEITGLEYTA